MREFFLSYIMQMIVNFSFKTSKITIHGGENLNDAEQSDSPVLFCVWHYRLIYAVYFFKNPQYNLHALISGHRDAEVLAKIMSRWKINLIRGSSTRGWKHAIVEMQKRLKDELNINNSKINQISNTNYRVYMGPFDNIKSLKNAFDDINPLNFENIEIIKL